MEDFLVLNLIKFVITIPVSLGSSIAIFVSRNPDTQNFYQSVYMSHVSAFPFSIFTVIWQILGQT
jgi:hypothetical protein